MGSATKAEIGGLYLNAQDAIPIYQCLIDMGHPQPPTPLCTDNSASNGLVTVKFQRRRSKSIDMHFHWLRNHITQK